MNRTEITNAYNISLFFGLLRGMFTFLRMFNSTRYIVNMIIKIFYIMFKFLVCVLLLLWVFSVSLLSMDVKNKTDIYKGNFYNAFLDAYQLMMMNAMIMPYDTFE